MPVDTNPLELTDEERLDIFGACAKRISKKLRTLESDFSKARSMEEMALGKDFTAMEKESESMVMEDGLPYMLNRETSSLMVSCVAHRAVIASIYAIEREDDGFRKIEESYDNLVKAAEKLLRTILEVEKENED